jgi:hypothetical protein
MAYIGSWLSITKHRNSILAAQSVQYSCMASCEPATAYDRMSEYARRVGWGCARCLLRNSYRNWRVVKMIWLGVVRMSWW